MVDPTIAVAVKTRRSRTAPGWLPLLLMVALMFAIGGYAAGRNADFLTSFNLSTLFGSSGALPLALVAMGQTHALMVKGFDISVGALMTLVVCVGSYLLTADADWYVLLLAAIGLVAMGCFVGFVNAALIRRLGLPSIIATLATLSVMQGVSLRLRPTPGGEINTSFADTLNTTWGFMSVAFIAVVVLAVACDIWYYRTASGLTSRAIGLDEESSRRLGLRPERVGWRAFVVSSLFATLAGFFLAAQVGIGDARVGSNYALTSIAAAVLGGASLIGGRGSFVGAVVGALFLSLIINILPLPNILPGFLREWSDALPLICIGALTLLALVLYQSPELWTRARAAWQDRRSAPATGGS